MRTETPDKQVKIARMTASQRRGLQAGSVAGIVIGLGLVVYGFYSFATSALTGQPPLVAMGIFLAGGIVAAISQRAAHLAFMRPLSELTATETGRAVEHGAERMGTGLGRGLGSAGFNVGTGSQTVIKVKCRSCGFLDTEDARFCSGCGAGL